MTSTIKVNKIEKVDGSTIEIGGPGTAVNLACGATQTGFGRTGTVDWCTTAKTSPFTSESGKGYFVNTTSSTITVTLPASPSGGDIVSIKDYARTFACNAVTVCRNSSKMCGTCFNTTFNTKGLSATLIYVDGTKGWQLINDDATTQTGASFITATGGNAVLTCGNFKTHVFTGDGTFCVSAVGNPAGSTTVDYVVVAGGGSSGKSSDLSVYSSGGGGAGGFRLSNSLGIPAPTMSPLASPTALPVSVQGYPVTVGGGGTGNYSAGSNSIFSTITSAGGGVGGINATSGPNADRTPGLPGGSGGGGSSSSPPNINGSGGTGNTPPVNPAQGTDGGSGQIVGATAGGGGGGAGGAGGNGPNPVTTGGAGGIGSFIADGFLGPTAPSYGTPGPVSNVRYFAGGGAGGAGYPGAAVPGGTGGAGGGGDGGPTGVPNEGDTGTINTGGGAGGSKGNPTYNAKAGGSGIVLIRYRFQ
tara:strand:+ start:1086 stop:2501 length:1416 start_codon:yes stop_codon:yes gene_type:complete